MKIISLLLICCTLTLAACDSEPRARQAKFYAFGTEIGVSLYDVDKETANNTIDILEQTFSNVNNTWHAWQPSTLTRINEAIASKQAIAIEQDVAQLISLASSLAKDSQHLFNPAAGKLFELWGFHQDNWFESRPPPSAEDINNWLASNPTMADIDIENGKLTSTNPAVKLGFGGFAKGYAVDQAIAALQQQGISDAIVNIGGDLRAIGSHGKRPWIVGIRHPRQEGILASIAFGIPLQFDAVFTEGIRNITRDDVQYAEELGYRIKHLGIARRTPAGIDAAATALFVAGEDWPNMAAAMAIDHVMLVRSDGQIELSPKMVDRVQLINNRKPVIIRSAD